MKEKAGLSDIHEIKDEEIIDAMLQDENICRSQNV